MSDLPKKSSLADGLEALPPTSFRPEAAPDVTGQKATSNPWKPIPVPASLGLIAARQTEPTPHCMTALAWLPPENLNVRVNSDPDTFFAAAWHEVAAGQIAPLEAEPMELRDSLGRSWWVLSGGPWAPLDLLLQTWPTPPASVLADWNNQRDDWMSLAARFPSIKSNRTKDEEVRTRPDWVAMEDPQRWWVDRQGALLPFADVWPPLSHLARTLKETSQSTATEKGGRATAIRSSIATANRSQRDLRPAPEHQSTPTSFQSKTRSKTTGSASSPPNSGSNSGSRKRPALFWVGAVTLGLLGLLIPQVFQGDSTPATTQRAEVSGEPADLPGGSETKPAPTSTVDPFPAVAQDSSAPLDLQGLSPTTETDQQQLGLELSSPNLFPEGDLKTKLDRLLGGSPGEPLASTDSTDILPEELPSQTDSLSEIPDPDSVDQTSSSADSPGEAPTSDPPSPASLENRSFPLDNLPLKSKWILRDRGLDPLLSLVLDLERQEGWVWKLMPIPLQAGKAVKAWGSHQDHPEAGGMVIQASLRTGRVWLVEVDIGWSPDPESPPVRLSIGQADQWLGEVQSGLRWHDQALQQLRQTRNLTNNTSQRSLMLDQIRTLEGQQRALKELELRWQKVAQLSQIFYDQQVIHLRWQSGATDAESATAIPDPP